MTETDRRPTHPMFPGRRPGQPGTAPVAPGSIPRLNGLPEPKFYRYGGSDRDTLTGFMDARLSLECLDERCGKCTDPDCADACHDEPRGTS